MYAAYYTAYIQWYIYVYFNGSPMFWVTQRPLLRVHSSSGRCARQRSRLVSPRKHLHEFWQEIALNCRHIQHEFAEYSSWKTQASKVNLSSWKPTTLPSCLPFPPYPSQDPSNGSSSGKILFVFLQSAQFVLWKHSCDQFHCFGLESPQWNTKISMTYPAVQSCCKWSSAAIKLASGTLGGEHDFQEVEKRECAIWTCDVYSVRVSAICGTAQMTLGMNPMQHCNQPQTCLRDVPKLLGHIYTDVYINNYNNYYLSKIVRFFNRHINSTGFTTRVSAVEALRRTELFAQQLLQHPFHLNHPRLTLHKNCHYRNATDAPLQRCWLQQTSHLRRQSAIKASKTSIICSWVDFSTGPILFFLTHA